MELLKKGAVKKWHIMLINEYEEDKMNIIRKKTTHHCMLASQPVFSQFIRAQVPFGLMSLEPWRI